MRAEAPLWTKSSALHGKRQFGSGARFRAKQCGRSHRRREEAAAAYSRALELAANPVERTFLEGRLAEVERSAE